MRLLRSGVDPSSLWGLSVWLHQRGRRRLARLVKLLNYLLFRAILPPEATMIEVPNLMHHGLGVVIHPTTCFGSGVSLGHQVTVAASPKDELGHVHPVVFEDNVFVGVGAIIIARSGPLRIGSGAVIGAGSVVLHDVAPGEKVVGNPARPVHR